jgi:hypothetical protein
MARLQLSSWHRLQHRAARHCASPRARPGARRLIASISTCRPEILGFGAICTVAVIPVMERSVIRGGRATEPSSPDCAALHPGYGRHFLIDISLHISYIILAPVKDMARRHTVSWERGRCPRVGLQPAPGRLGHHVSRHYDRGGRCFPGLGQAKAGNARSDRVPGSLA